MAGLWAPSAAGVEGTEAEAVFLTVGRRQRNRPVPQAQGAPSLQPPVRRLRALGPALLALRRQRALPPCQEDRHRQLDPMPLGSGPQEQDRSRQCRPRLAGRDPEWALDNRKPIPYGRRIALAETRRSLGAPTFAEATVRGHRAEVRRMAPEDPEVVAPLAGDVCLPAPREDAHLGNRVRRWRPLTRRGSWATARSPVVFVTERGRR